MASGAAEECVRGRTGVGVPGDTPVIALEETYRLFLTDLWCSVFRRRHTFCSYINAEQSWVQL